MSSSFDLTLAVRCAEAIAAMYRGTLPPTLVDHVTDTQVRIEEAHAGEFIILFPGTASVRDWKTDARFLKTDWDGEDAMTHRGFTAAIRAVGEKILEELRAKKATSVILTGHSLGGALATLCADLCADVGVDVTAVYTYGSPRVGNHSFAKQYNDDLAEVTFRIVNARDPVPWLPLPIRSLRTGIYTHVAQQVYLKHTGGVEFEPWLPHVVDAVATLVDRSQEQQFLGDILTARCHQMSAYLTKLKQLA